jgi:hypothetical protein
MLSWLSPHHQLLWVESLQQESGTAMDRVCLQEEHIRWICVSAELGTPSCKLADYACLGEIPSQ